MKFPGPTGRTRVTQILMPFRLRNRLKCPADKRRASAAGAWLTTSSDNWGNTSGRVTDFLLHDDLSIPSKGTCLTCPKRTLLNFS